MIEMLHVLDSSARIIKTCTMHIQKIQVVPHSYRLSILDASSGALKSSLIITISTNTAGKSAN